MFLSKKQSRKSRAFSLVEVVLALGVTSFAVLALIGTLPTGIKSVQDSSNETARANILQQIRAELQEVNFGTGAGNLTTLSSQVNYYDNEGNILADSTRAYYKAVFTVNPAFLPNTSSAQQFQSSSAQTIQVTLSYPYTAPAASQTMSTNYLLAAKQKNY